MSLAGPRTALAALVLPPSTALEASLAIGYALAGADDRADRVVRRWCRRVLRLAGARLVSAGAEGLDPTRTYVFVSNHLSHMDAPSIVVSWPGPLRFVGKDSLFKIPVFGHALAALGHIRVDRGNTQQARESLARAVEPVRERVSVLFFAEGTRSATGDLLPFKKGCLAFAEAAGVPVVPVGVAGTRDILHKGSPVLHGGAAAVAFGTPLEGALDAAVPRETRLAALREAVAGQVARAEGLLSR